MTVVIAVGLLNLVLSAVAFLMANRAFEGLALGIIILLCFVPMGIAFRFWSTRWWTAALPAAAGYICGLGAVKWAIHLTDTRGAYAPSMAQYILAPSNVELLLALLAAAATAAGWAAVSPFIRLRQP